MKKNVLGEGLGERGRFLPAVAAGEAVARRARTTDTGPAVGAPVERAGRGRGRGAEEDEEPAPAGRGRILRLTVEVLVTSAGLLALHSPWRARAQPKQRVG